MIARIWRGRVPESKSDEYAEYIKETGVADIKRVKGNKGVFLLRRNEAIFSCFMVLSLWDSFDSIRKFAGDEVDKAQYYPQDNDFLIEKDQKVFHYEIVESSEKLWKNVIKARW